MCLLTVSSSQVNTWESRAVSMVACANVFLCGCIDQPRRASFRRDLVSGNLMEDFFRQFPPAKFGTLCLKCWDEVCVCGSTNTTYFIAVMVFC